MAFACSNGLLRGKLNDKVRADIGFIAPLKPRLLKMQCCSVYFVVGCIGVYKRYLGVH